MCCLFGMIDYGHSLTAKQKNRILSVLSSACESRGTDATGIAYNSQDRLRIYKRPFPAHLLWLQIPGDAWAIMGHTRMTTQGSEARNYNNHPFPGRTKYGQFALAHNGMLYNDHNLRKSLSLPKTKIETDSYIAVQLIERKNALNFDSLKDMAEQVEGSFTFTVLDHRNNLYIVKGDNPMCLYHYPKLRLYLYASTESILQRALSKTRLSDKHHEKIKLNCGDILQIDGSGNRTRGQFSVYNLLHWNDLTCMPYSYGHQQDTPTLTMPQSYLDEIKSVASAFGYPPEIIDRLAAQGFSAEELEEFLYCGEL